MNATLLSLYGNDTDEDSFGLSGDDVHTLHGLSMPTVRILRKWRSLTPRQQKLAAARNPELMGVLPIIAKIAAGAAKIGGKLVGAIAKKVREKRAARANASANKIAESNAAQAQAQAQVQAQAQAQAAAAAKPAMDISKLAPYLIPAVALVAVMLLKKK
jgi:hypothetical protein